MHPTVDAKGNMTVPFIHIAFTDGDVQVIQANRPYLWIFEKLGSWRWFSDAGKQPVNEDEVTDVESDSDDESGIESGEESAEGRVDETDGEMSDGEIGENGDENTDDDDDKMY